VRASGIFPQPYGMRVGLPLDVNSSAKAKWTKRQNLDTALTRTDVSLETAARLLYALRRFRWQATSDFIADHRIRDGLRKYMRARILILTFVTVITFGFCLTTMAADDPSVGTWKLDPSESNFNSGPPPIRRATPLETSRPLTESSGQRLVFRGQAHSHMSLN
jgi:hypothetical protein